MIKLEVGHARLERLKPLHLNSSSIGSQPTVSGVTDRKLSATNQSDTATIENCVEGGGGVVQ